MPAQKAFPLGRVLVMPSRAESFPYVVLEAAAAGMPIVASRVGGIVEMLSPQRLVAPGDPAALATAILDATSNYGALALDAAFEARRLERRFNVRGMAEGVLAFYASLLNPGQEARDAPTRVWPVSSVS
jgi:glycosyltransferase involved in cell wall biosynthesis